jgi:hypothetical protein
MKKISIYITGIAAMICGFVSCDDDFMNRVPKTSLTAPGFFKSAEDLKLYVNELYNQLLPGPAYDDRSSDNVAIWKNVDPYQSLLYGRLSADNAGNDWGDFGRLRSVNMMLEYVGDGSAVTGAEADVRNYIGIARYFRARIYIGMVQAYSDVPWYDKVIGSGEEDLLYRKQDPRDFVVDKIMEDLEYAVANVSAEMGNRTRVHKYVTLAELSRFALYEGTYRKYHSEIGLASSAGRFLERAVSASEEIMNSGEFEITGGTGVETLAAGIKGSPGFRALFTSLAAELAANREIILWKEYGRELSLIHKSGDLTKDSPDYSLNRSLQESFLTKDGEPFSTVAGYDTKEYKDVFADRDPRMAETIIWPGLKDDKSSQVSRPRLGGYLQSKFFIRTIEPEYRSDDYTAAFTSLPVFRYGEVLLNYAEAKAELGQLDAGSVAKSINLLRDRVGMPSFNARREVDATLKSLYPGVNDDNILAVRRERRVELAGEGLRKHDIYRWNAGKVFELPISQQGIYVPQLPYVYDVTGDGDPDNGIAASMATRDESYPNVAWYDLDNASIEFYLDASNFVRNVGDTERSFVEPTYYYTPIPTAQIVLNPELEQPYGWEKINN